MLDRVTVKSVGVHRFRGRAVLDGVSRRRWRRAAVACAVAAVLVAVLAAVGWSAAPPLPGWVDVGAVLWPVAGAFALAAVAALGIAPARSRTGEPSAPDEPPPWLADRARQVETTFRDAEQQHGPDHVDTIIARHHLAYARLALGRPAEGIRLYEVNLAVAKRALGPEHRQTLVAHGALANALTVTGRSRRALRLLRAIEAHSDGVRSLASSASKRRASAGAMRGGRSLHELTNAAEHLRAVAAGEPSTFRFQP
jgi:hypothetical protein